MSFVVVREINNLGLEYIMTYNVRFGANIDNVMATNFNSNEMGLYAIIAVSLSLLLFTYTKKIRYVIGAILVTLLGIMSISRTFMLMAAIVWFVYLIKEKVNIGFKIFISCLFVIILVMIFVTVPDIAEWIQSFFQKRSMESGGRGNLLSYYFDLQFSSFYGFLFGYTQMYLKVFGADTAVHNAIQEMLISWGIIGAIISISWIMLIIRSVVKCIPSDGKRHISRWIPISIFLVYVQAIQFFLQHNYIIIFAIALVGITIECRGGKDETSNKKNYTG